MLALALALLEPLHSQVAREDGTPPEQTLGGLLAIGFVLVTLSLIHLGLRRLKKSGQIDYDEHKMGRGLGNAMGALGSMLTPNHAPPENLPVNVEVVDQDFSEGEGDTPAPRYLQEDGQYPSDGLRRGPPPDM